MFEDDSEDEDEQLNFEIDKHMTEWINIIGAHAYRGEIRKNIENDATLSEQERKRRLNLNKESDSWLQKGIAINQANKLYDAIPCYTQALKLNPDNFLSMFNLAANYERLQKFGSAFKWFKMAAETKPNMEIAHCAAGLNAFKLGRYKEALKSFRDCIGVYEELKASKIL